MLAQNLDDKNLVNCLMTQYNQETKYEPQRIVSYYPGRPINKFNTYT